MMELLIISLIAGAVAGNGAGALRKNLGLGTLGNSIIGILGGGLGTTLLGMRGDGSGAPADMDLGLIVVSIASGGVGGGVLIAIVGMLKGMMSKT